jgi:pectinesterase
MRALGLLPLILLTTAPATAAPARPTDDSYTIGQRFERYRGTYPGIAWTPVKWRDGQVVRFDRPYKSTGTRDLHIDVFEAAPRAVPKRQGIVLVHGGAWSAGNKNHFYALANLLAQRGYTVFLPEFRLSPEAKYPAGMTDIGDALAWARAHAREFGLSPDRIAIGGASSGGQMAALLAYAGPTGLFGAGADRRANALIDLDGVLDFADPAALKFENAAGEDSSAARWLGGSFERAPERWREASAASYVETSAVPTLILSSGIERFTVGKDRVLSALTRQHVANRFFAFSDAPHDFWLFEPWLPKAAAEIDGFLSMIGKTAVGKRW